MDMVCGQLQAVTAQPAGMVYGNSHGAVARARADNSGGSSNESSRFVLCCPGFLFLCLLVLSCALPW